MVFVHSTKPLCVDVESCTGLNYQYICTFSVGATMDKTSKTDLGFYPFLLISIIFVASFLFSFLTNNCIICLQRTNKKNLSKCIMKKSMKLYAYKNIYVQNILHLHVQIYVVHICIYVYVCLCVYVYVCVKCVKANGRNVI